MVFGDWVHCTQVTNLRAEPLAVRPWGLSPSAGSVALRPPPVPDARLHSSPSFCQSCYQLPILIFLKTQLLNSSTSVTVFNVTLSSCLDYFPPSTCFGFICSFSTFLRQTLRSRSYFLTQSLNSAPSPERCFRQTVHIPGRPRVGCWSHARSESP